MLLVVTDVGDVGLYIVTAVKVSSRLGSRTLAQRRVMFVWEGNTFKAACVRVTLDVMSAYYG